MHVFSDASNQAIGAVAYLRVFNGSDRCYVFFLSAKAKMTPLHEVSIPRLELCGSVLATTLAQTVTSEMRGRLTIDSTTFYTDSMVVLGYIHNQSKRFHVYVANRVHRIHKQSEPNQWVHVPTSHNPADLATRTVPASQLASTSWLKGPDFLWKNSSDILIQPYNRQIPLDDNDPEIRRQAKVNITNLNNTNNQSYLHLSCERFSRFSTWMSLKRAIATLISKVISFKSRRHANPDPPQTKISLLQRAETVIFTAVQKKHFHTEIKDLKQITSDDKDHHNVVKKESTLYRLSPFIGEDGIICVGGRLRRADLDLSGKHPVLLPKNSHVSRLVIQHFHNELQHQGRQTTCAALRSGGRWIIGADDVVRSIINQCITCRRLRGKRQIRTVRHVLDSMFIQLGKNQFTHEVLCTFMAEVCSIVNSRPITTVSSDANDPQALTPAMLLTLKTQPVEAPPGEFVREDLYGRQRWRRVQYLADQFWLRWRSEYLQSLQPRQKWNKSRPNVSEGDVVLLREKDVARNHWPLARVIKALPGDDGKVRKVEVLTCRDGCCRTYLRPISELVLIEKAMRPAI